MGGRPARPPSARRRLRLTAPAVVSPRCATTCHGRVLPRLGQPAAALGPRHHGDRLDRLVVLLRLPRQQPDAAAATPT
ncbi:MAG: hypothetical protein MZW92_23210 [Comamonadaceae bacterium]|nr:hypothetical protein [Comamonadaceae bacterium]